MLVKLVHNNRIGAYTFMLLLIILLWLKPILSGAGVDVDSFNAAMPLWKLFSFTANIAWLGFLFSVIATIFITLSLTRFNSRYGLLSQQTALPGFIYILLVGSISQVQIFHPVWVATIFLIVALEYLFEAHHYRKTMKECFLASFWLSVSSLFSFKVILLFPLLLIVMGTLRVLSFKSFLAAIIGLVLPWLLLWGYALSLGNMADYYNYLSFSIDKLFHLYKGYNDLVLIILLTVAFIYLIGLFSVIGSYGSKKIFTRKQYQVFIYCSLYLMAFMVLTGAHFQFLTIVMVPVAIIIAHLLDSIRSVLWKNTLFILLIATTLIGQIFI